MSRSEPGAESSKEQWRLWAKQARAEVDWEEISAATVAGIQAWMMPDPYLTVLVFLPMAEEINLMPLVEADLVSRFVATRTPDRDGELTVHELGGPLEVHRLGFLQPHDSASMVGPDEIDVALLPGLSFDLHGERLGRGAGYFDRLLLTMRPNARRVGVVPAALVVDKLPTEPHDIAMDYLATEEGVIATA